MEKFTVLNGLVAPLIIGFTVVGAFAPRGYLFDMVIALVFGVLGLLVAMPLTIAGIALLGLLAAAGTAWLIEGGAEVDIAEGADVLVAYPGAGVEAKLTV